MNPNWLAKSKGDSPLSTIDTKIILEKIARHCNDIFADITNYNYDDFLLDFKTQRAVFMSLHQIGELSSRLPSKFRERHENIPWSAIRQVRNIIAHEYVRINLDIIWMTITGDIPTLHSYVTAVIKRMDENKESASYEKD